MGAPFQRPSSKRPLTGAGVALTVLFALASGGRAQILNPSFEFAGPTASAPDDWSKTNVGGFGSNDSDPQSVTHLDRAWRLYSANNSSFQEDDYIWLDQLVDLSDADTLFFDAHLKTGNSWGTRFVAELLIDNDVVWSATTLGHHNDQAIDVSNYCGSHYLRLRLRALKTMGSTASHHYAFDNLRIAPITTCNSPGGVIIDFDAVSTSGFSQTPLPLPFAEEGFEVTGFGPWVQGDLHPYYSGSAAVSLNGSPADHWVLQDANSERFNLCSMELHHEGNTSSVTLVGIGDSPPSPTVFTAPIAACRVDLMGWTDLDAVLFATEGFGTHDWSAQVDNLCVCPSASCTCQPTLVGTLGRFCIIGSYTGTYFWWQLNSVAPKSLPPPTLSLGASNSTIAAAFVTSIQNAGIAGLSASLSNPNSCFAVNYGSPFKFYVGTSGNSTKCEVTNNPGGCTFNPLIIEEEHVDQLVVGTLDLAGTAEGGSVGLLLAGISIQYFTTGGDSAADVVQGLAAAINAESTLTELGVSAGSEGRQLITFGAVPDSVSVDDAGLYLLESLLIPTLPLWGGIVLAVLLTAVANHRLRKR